MTIINDWCCSWGFFGCNRLRILLTLSVSIIRVSWFSCSILFGAIRARLATNGSCLLFEAQLTLDKVIIICNLISECANNLLFPVILSLLNFFFELLVSFYFTIVSNGNQLVFEISEWEYSKLNVEVVEDIRVISLQRNLIWTHTNHIDTFNFLSLLILLIDLKSSSISCSCSSFINSIIFLSLSGLRINVRTFRIGFHFINKNSHFDFSQDNINIVVDFNIHLDCINDVKLTSTFFIVSVLIRNSTLSCQDLCHVIILDVG